MQIHTIKLLLITVIAALECSYSGEYKFLCHMYGLSGASGESYVLESLEKSL